MRSPIIFAPILLCALAACTGGRPDSTDTTTPDTPSAATTQAAPPEQDSDTTWTVSGTGIGPVRPGMTVAEASAALGGDFRSIGDSTCGYGSSGKAPEGVKFMIVDGAITRIEVDSGPVETTRGARIGDTEDRIKALYPGQVVVTPHKYNPGGHYLTVTPAASADTVHRMVFETDSARVTRYRTGLLPSVEWVEGCS